MRYVHAGCGGRIDVRKRQCTRCRKRWNTITFRLTLTEIRPVFEKSSKEVRPSRVVRLEGRHAKWARGVPGVSHFATLLPNWPRWVRIAATVGLSVTIVVVVILIGR